MKTLHALVDDNYGLWLRARRRLFTTLGLTELLILASLMLMGLSTYHLYRVITPHSPVSVAEAKVIPREVEQSMPRSTPSQLRIVSIGIDAPIVTLALDKNGAMQTPKNGTDTGWYIHSPTPGEKGPSVIAAHVDTKQGPAVFWKLATLKTGDTIEVARTDGSIARFSVDSVEQFSQDAFPTDRVYGNTDTAEIRLITCGGAFSKETKRYSHNTIAFGTLIK
jgi:LPXTG-site transpeptidase (sortase) family protein